MVTVAGFAKTKKLTDSYHRLSNMQNQDMMKKCRKLRSAMPATQIDPRGKARRRPKSQFFKKLAIKLLILEGKSVKIPAGVS